MFKLFTGLLSIGGTLSFQYQATVDISTQLFQLPAVAFHWFLGFSPSTCVVQESAKDLRVFMKILPPLPICGSLLYGLPMYNKSAFPRALNADPDCPRPAKLPLYLSASFMPIGIGKYLG